MPSPSDRLTGTCQRWRPEVAYGFIRPDGAIADVFAHVTGLRTAPWLTPGDRVSFRLGSDRRGRLMAVDVDVLPRGHQHNLLDVDAPR